MFCYQPQSYEGEDLFSFTVYFHCNRFSCSACFSANQSIILLISILVSIVEHYAIEIVHFPGEISV